MTEETDVLEPGRKLRHRLTPRQVRGYQVTLERDEFASIAVEQRGVDVLVRLVSPSGEVLTEVDSPTGTTGFERVTEVAAAAGLYRVEVEAFAGGAEDGFYEIALEATRPATPTDRSRVAADRAFAHGEVLRREERPREALAEYETALAAWRALGDRENEAAAVYRTGWALHELQSHQEAAERYRAALELYRELGDRPQEAAVANRLGRALLLLGRLAEAAASHQRSLELFVELRDPQGEAAASNNLGNAHKWTGRTEEALAAYERALAIWERSGETRYLVTARLNLGDVYLANGDLDVALLSFEEALAGSRRAEDRNAEATSLLKMGEALADAERFEEARASLEAALVLRRELEDRRGQAVVLSSLGTLQLKLDQLPEARRLLEEALRGFEEVGDPLGRALAHHKLGRYHYAAGDAGTARRHHELALPLFQSSGDRQGVASARYGIARALYASGDFPGARRVLEEVLESVGNLREEAESLHLRGSYLASRRHYWDLYVASLMRLHDQSPGSRFDLLALQATEGWRARGLLELLDEAGVQIRDGAPADLLAREGRIARDLDALARMRLELTDRPATEESLQELADRETELLAELDRTRSQIRTQSSRYRELADPDPLDLSSIQQSLLDPDTVLLAYFLGEERSFLWAVSKRSITSYVLPPRGQIEAAASEYHELLARHSSRAADHLRAVGEGLTRMLLEPAASTFGSDRLVIVADGTLHYVPFAALPAPGASGAEEILLERHEVVNLPSASVLASLRRTQAVRPRAPKTIAVLADPVFESDDPRIARRGVTKAGSPLRGREDTLHQAVRGLRTGGLRRLPHSAEEARAILELVPETSRLAALGVDAAYPLLENDHLAQYRILHFATHGLIHRDHPELSGLVLSLFDDEGAPVRGFLRLHEIYNLRLGAELVVLSACETGLGRELEGEGLVGLTRGFLYAGAPRVVHTLWEVGDASSAELMKRFYERLLTTRTSPAAALREAQLSMRSEDEWSAPFHWAGFVLQGDWRGPQFLLTDDDIETEDKGGVDPGGGVKPDEDLPPPDSGPPPGPIQGYTPPPPPFSPRGGRS